MMLGAGFTAFIGEAGAGKSILPDYSLGLVLGVRGVAALGRPECGKRGQSTPFFNLAPDHTVAFLDDKI